MCVCMYGAWFCACEYVCMSVQLCDCVGVIQSEDEKLWDEEQVHYYSLTEIYVQSCTVAQQGLLSQAGNLNHGFSVRVEGSATSPSIQNTQHVMDNPAGLQPCCSCLSVLTKSHVSTINVHLCPFSRRCRHSEVSEPPAGWQRALSSHFVKDILLIWTDQ